MPKKKPPLAKRQKASPNIQKKKKVKTPKKVLAGIKKIKKKVSVVKKSKKIIKKVKNSKKAFKKNIAPKGKVLKKKTVLQKPAGVKAIKSPAKKIIAKKRPKPALKPQKIKTSFPAESFFKAKIKVIGIGGGGGSIVSEIGRSLGKATFMVADTDMRAFKKRAGIKQFLFGRELTHGLGTGVNPQLGRLAAEKEKDRISHFFDDQDIVIFIASLGGGLGSGATQVFAEAAKNFNGITLGIFTLPFKFEGKNKYSIAYKALAALRKSLNVSITIPNERIFKIIDADTAITDAFSMVNKNLIESLESLIDLIYNPGIINIDFADLRAILSGKGNLAFLNTAEASGKDRAQVISEKILRNELYQNNNFTAEKILFNIEGGRNLSMFEVDKISRKIAEQNPASKIIFGISKNAALKNKIKTTLLMTGGGAKPIKTTPKVRPAPAKKIEKVAAKSKTVKEKRQAQVLPKSELLVAPTDANAGREKILFEGSSLEIFSKMPSQAQEVEAGSKKLEITEAPVKPKRAIRRSALEIKKAQEKEESKQSLQEKEWEIPAFLRLKK